MEQLRPLALGEILDGGIQIFRRWFTILVGVAAVALGVPTVVLLFTALNARQNTAMAVGGALLGVCLYIVGSLAATGATVRVVSDAYLGRQPSLWGALGFALNRAWRIFVAGMAKALVILLAECGVGIVAVIGVAAMGANSPGAFGLIFLLMIVGIAVAVVLAAGYAVVTQSVVLEELDGATDALPRSWRLTSGFRGRAVLLGLTVFMMLAIPVTVTSALSAIIPSWSSGLDALGTILWMLLYPLFGCVFTLYYYDLRIRKEAFDLEQLGAQLADASRSV